MRFQDVATLVTRMLRAQDDVVWLAPFLTNNVSKLSRIRNVSIYVAVCLAALLEFPILFVGGAGLVMMHFVSDICI